MKLHLWIALLTVTLIMVPSCEKEKIDYRMTYTGDFHFTTVVRSWNLSTDTGLYKVVSYDTSEYEGFIRKYEPGDDELDLYTGLDSLTSDSTLFIQFTEYSAITNIVDPDGSFVPRTGHHYWCTGSFLGEDSLSFSIQGLGGLGGGWDYFVGGSRK
jgi:hypothetical protein